MFVFEVHYAVKREVPFPFYMTYFQPFWMQNMFSVTTHKMHYARSLQVNPPLISPRSTSKWGYCSLFLQHISSRSTTCSPLGWWQGCWKELGNESHSYVVVRIGVESFWNSTVGLYTERSWNSWQLALTLCCGRLWRRFSLLTHKNGGGSSIDYSPPNNGSDNIR